MTYSSSTDLKIDRPGLNLGIGIFHYLLSLSLFVGQGYFDCLYKTVCGNPILIQSIAILGMPIMPSRG